MPGSKCRLIKEAKHRVSSLASGPSLGYLVPYERIELLDKEVSQPQRTFFLKLGGLISVAGFVSILTLLALRWGRLSDGANTTTFSGQAEVPRACHSGVGRRRKTNVLFRAGAQSVAKSPHRWQTKSAVGWRSGCFRARPSGNYRAELIELYKSQLKTPEVTVSLEASITTRYSLRGGA